MTVCSCKADGWAVEYVITDTGAGMTEKTKEKVFQSFFSNKGSDGTGIGLMMARKIVEQHGGEIEFHSELGKGSTFLIRLPASTLVDIE